MPFPFLWGLSHRNESKFVRKFLIAQQLNATKNDLCLQFDEDLETCGITLTMSEITNMKKNKFRKLVYSQLR